MYQGLKIPLCRNASHLYSVLHLQQRMQTSINYSLHLIGNQEPLFLSYMWDANFISHLKSATGSLHFSEGKAEDSRLIFFF